MLLLAAVQQAVQHRLHSSRARRQSWQSECANSSQNFPAVRIFHEFSNKLSQFENNSKFEHVLIKIIIIIIEIENFMRCQRWPPVTAAVLLFWN